MQHMEGFRSLNEGSDHFLKTIEVGFKLRSFFWSRLSPEAFPPPSSAVVLQLLADVLQPEPPAPLSGRLPAGERRGLLHQSGSGL